MLDYFTSPDLMAWTSYFSLCFHKGFGPNQDDIESTRETFCIDESSDVISRFFPPSFGSRKSNSAVYGQVKTLPHPIERLPIETLRSFATAELHSSPTTDPQLPVGTPPSPQHVLPHPISVGENKSILRRLPSTSVLGRYQRRQKEADNREISRSRHAPYLHLIDNFTSRIFTKDLVDGDELAQSVRCNRSSSLRHCIPQGSLVKRTGKPTITFDPFGFDSISTPVASAEKRYLGGQHALLPSSVSAPYHLVSPVMTKSSLSFSEGNDRHSDVVPNCQNYSYPEGVVPNAFQYYVEERRRLSPEPEETTEPDSFDDFPVCEMSIAMRLHERPRHSLPQFCYWCFTSHIPCA